MTVVLGLLAGLRQSITAWDRSAFHAVNKGLGCPVLDVIMPLITDLGLGHVQVGGLLLAACLIGALRGEFRGRTLLKGVVEAIVNRRRWIVPAIVALTLTGMAVQIPKRMHRQRPSWYYVNQRRSGRDPHVEVRTISGRRPLRVNGFPSGHTATSTAIALVLTVRLPRRRGYGAAVAASWLLVAAIGVSRVYMADHWPLDVIGGAAFGSVGGVVALVAAKWRGRKAEA